MSDWDGDGDSDFDDGNDDDGTSFDSDMNDTAGLPVVEIDGERYSVMETYRGEELYNEDGQVVATRELDGDIRWENGDTWTPMGEVMGRDTYHSTDDETITLRDGITGITSYDTEGGPESNDGVSSDTGTSGALYDAGDVSGDGAADNGGLYDTSSGSMIRRSSRGKTGRRKQNQGSALGYTHSNSYRRLSFMNVVVSIAGALLLSMATSMYFSWMTMIVVSNHFGISAALLVSLVLMVLFGSVTVIVSAVVRFWDSLFGLLITIFVPLGWLLGVVTYILYLLWA